MTKALNRVSGLFLLSAVLVSLVGCAGNPPVKFEETREMMDTYVKVTVYAEEDAGQEVIDAAFARMEEIEAIATSWDSSGEAYKLNESGYLDNPSGELVELLTLSKKYYDITGGYFDITVQPLLDLWKFKPDAEKQFWELGESDQQAAIDETMKLVGSDRIIVEDGSVRLEEGTLITLGGIAKGYAADEALETIAGMGIKNALIDAGGDIRALGAKPDGENWGIALVNPDDTSQMLAGFLVEDMSVTTSGNYERYFDEEKEVHHILNPKTGYSANECISVSIITENGAMADALATGVFALGPEEGMKLVESLDNVEAFIVDSNRNIHRSSGVSGYLYEE